MAINYSNAFGNVLRHWIEELDMQSFNKIGLWEVDKCWRFWDQYIPVKVVVKCLDLLVDQHYFICWLTYLSNLYLDSCILHLVTCIIVILATVWAPFIDERTLLFVLVCEFLCLRIIVVICYFLILWLISWFESIIQFLWRWFKRI